jgi:hypothetical protein
MSPRLEPDPLVQLLRPDPDDIDVDLVALDGYLGESKNGKQALYHDLSLSLWVEIEEDDLIHKETVSVRGGPDASVVWVRRSAMLTTKTSPEDPRSRLPRDQISPVDLLTEGDPPLWSPLYT